MVVVYDKLSENIFANLRRVPFVCVCAIRLSFIRLITLKKNLEIVIKYFFEIKVISRKSN